MSPRSVCRVQRWHRRKPKDKGGEGRSESIAIRSTRYERNLHIPLVLFTFCCLLTNLRVADDFKFKRKTPIRGRDNVNHKTENHKQI
jgi:hypothetical protein